MNEDIQFIRAVFDPQLYLEMLKNENLALEFINSVWDKKLKESSKNK